MMAISTARKIKRDDLLALVVYKETDTTDKLRALAVLAALTNKQMRTHHDLSPVGRSELGHSLWAAAGGAGRSGSK